VLQQAQAAALAACTYIWEHILRAPYELTVRILTTSFSTTWGRNEYSQLATSSTRSVALVY